MRILFYISTIRGGGAARVMTNLANQFVEDENKVYFVTNFLSDKEYPLDIKIRRYFVEESESNETVFKKNLRRILFLRKIIIKHRPDIVVSFMHENDVRAYLATRGTNVKLVLSIRNDPTTLYKNNRFKRMIASYVYSRANAVVFQTEDARRWFGENIEESKVILNQVADVFFETTKEKVGRDIVTFGKFLPQKNHMLLMEAYKQICDEIEDNLIIYGEGRLRNEYLDWIHENGLENRIFLPGNSDNVYEILSKSRLFVMSSNYEGMPNALMEAMAVGVPCIATDCPCGGPRELAQDGGVLLVPMNDVENLAIAIKKILSNREQESILIAKAKKTSEAFKPREIYQIWKGYFEYICNK